MAAGPSCTRYIAMAPRDDAVYLDLTFADETWAVSVPMPRWVAEGACYDFSQGTPLD